jgi:hypothetical protein
MTRKIVRVQLTIDVADLDDLTEDHYSTSRSFEPKPAALFLTHHEIDVLAERLADGYFTDDGRV